MPSHARVNSKSVRGAAGDACAAAARAGASVDVDADAGVESLGSGLAVARAGTSRVLNIVSFPDTRKMPPPTRPTDFVSRACLASLNDAGGLGFGVTGAASGAGSDVDVDAGAGVDCPSGGAEGDSTRELTGFKRSLVGGRVAADVEGWGGSSSPSSTMVMGMRRRFGGTVGDDDTIGGDVGTPIGGDRCYDVCDSGQGAVRRTEREHTDFPFWLTIRSSTRASSALTASLFGSSLSAVWRSGGQRRNEG